jgi:hypothetical protein
MNILKWTQSLSESFWTDLAGSEFLENIAFSRYAAPLLVDLAQKHLRKEGLILDFGAGHNLFMVKELLQRGYKVAYHEPNQDKSSRDFALEHHNFLGPVSEVGTQLYDGIFFSEVIEHLFDNQLSTVMTALSKALKPEGVLIVTTPDNENLVAASRYCPVCKHLFHPWGHVRSFTVETLEAFLRQFGFICEEFHNVDFSSAMKTVEEFKHVKQRIKEFAGILNEAINVTNGAERIFEKYVRLFEDILQSNTSENPLRKRIGFGGTLVALAKKHEVSDCPN